MKRILIILLSLSLLMVVGCSSNENIVETPERKEEVKEDSALDTKEDTEIIVKLNSEERTKEDQWDELEDGKELILINITVTNNSDGEYQFNPNYVQMNVDGHLEMTAMITPKDIEKMSSKEMLPGEEYTGVIPFEVEAGQEYRKLVYDDFDNQIELD